MVATGVVTAGVTAGIGSRPALAQVPVTSTTRPPAPTSTQPLPTVTSAPTTPPQATTSAPATSTTARRPPTTRITTTSTSAPPITAVTVPPNSTIPASTPVVQAAARRGEGHVSRVFPSLSIAGLVVALAILAGRWLRSRSQP